MNEFKEAIELREKLINYFIEVNKERNFFIEAINLDNFISQSGNVLHINTRLFKWDFYFDNTLKDNLKRFISEVVCIEMKYICKSPIKFTANGLNGTDEAVLFTLLPAGLGTS